jgi:Co/Zn/Cd efflux system component
VFGTGTGWPDVIVAATMAGLGISGGWQIINQAISELRQATAAVLPLAGTEGKVVAGRVSK